MLCRCDGFVAMEHNQGLRRISTVSKVAGVGSNKLVTLAHCNLSGLQEEPHHCFGFMQDAGYLAKGRTMVVGAGNRSCMHPVVKANPQLNTSTPTPAGFEDVSSPHIIPSPGRG